MAMHPDAAAVWSPVWSAGAPTLQDGRVLLDLIARTPGSEEEEDIERADEIARLLVPDSTLIQHGRTLFNKLAWRRYGGTHWSALAERREGPE